MKKHSTIKFTLIAGTCLIAVGIVLGAFGAHSLKTVLNDDQMVSYEVAVRYQLLQGFGLLILCMLETHYELDLKWSRRSLLLGVILFSGSIYLLVFKDFGPWGAISSLLGPVTPIGGLFMILAYVILAMKLIKKKV